MSECSSDNKKHKLHMDIYTSTLILDNTEHILKKYPLFPMTSTPMQLTVQTETGLRIFAITNSGTSVDVELGAEVGFVNNASPVLHGYSKKLLERRVLFFRTEGQKYVEKQRLDAKQGDGTSQARPFLLCTFGSSHVLPPAKK